MTFFTAQNIRSTLGGSWIARPAGEEFVGVSTDSRTVKPGEIFFALRGERFDGHSFLHAAMVSGAGVLVVDEPATILPEIQRNTLGVGVLKVSDCLEALARLASSYRRTLEGARVIAVTGSNGKTTTVRLIEAALSSKLRGTSSVKSYNNTIGVALTILSARPHDQYLICEVGSNTPGEIAALARIVEPDVAVITSIGSAHVGRFGSADEILREKASLLGFLRPHGLAVLPAGIDALDDLSKPVPNIVRFGAHESADLRLADVESLTDELAVRFTVNEREAYRIPLAGRHNAQNALAAIAVAKRLGLTAEETAAGLAEVRPEPMRFEPIEIGGVRFFNDAYNASPESTRASLETFAEVTAGSGRRVVILGDMLELGDHAEAAHREIGALLRELGVPDLLVVVGERALHIAALLEDAMDPERIIMLSAINESAAKRVVERLSPGDRVLIKGSRAMRLERIIDIARRQHMRSAPASAARVV